MSRRSGSSASPLLLRGDVDEPCPSQLAVLTKDLRVGAGGNLRPQPLGFLPHEPLALGRDRGDRALQLAGEASRRLLLSGPDRLAELVGRVLEQPRRLVLERPLQPLDLASLDVRKLDLDPRRRLRLLAVDALEQLALANAEPVGHL